MHARTTPAALKPPPLGEEKKSHFMSLVSMLFPVLYLMLELPPSGHLFSTCMNTCTCAPKGSFGCYYRDRAAFVEKKVMAFVVFLTKYELFRFGSVVSTRLKSWMLDWCATKALLFLPGTRAKK